MTSDTKNVSSADLAHQIVSTAAKIRRMTSGDPKYHSGRPKKQYASPYLEFLAKIETNARRMPQIY
ncbi:MAG: hypothetical protein ACKO1M_00505, partial [Planctomycetota bacterium]